MKNFGFAGKTFQNLGLLAVVLIGAASSASAQTMYSTDFDSMTTGSIYGQQGWANTNPASPYVQSVTAGAGLNGTQAWLLSSTYGNADDGAVIDIVAPSLSAAGESNTVFGGTPAYNEYNESFSFRTVATSDDPGLDISTSIGAAASVRNTYAEIYDNGGILTVDAFTSGVDGQFALPADNPSTVTPLVWGAWYELTVNAVFINGPNNDQVTYSLMDSTGATVWSATIGSWETLYAAGGVEDSPGPVASNRVSFDLNGGSTTADGNTSQGIYIDNFSESVGIATAPEPSTWALVLGGLVLLALTGRRFRAVQA